MRDDTQLQQRRRDGSEQLTTETGAVWTTTRSCSTPARRASSSASIGRPEVEAWRLEARGQIEGIGTSPRFSAKDGTGATLADRRVGRVGGARRAHRARCARGLAPLPVRRRARAWCRPPRRPWRARVLPVPRSSRRRFWRTARAGSRWLRSISRTTSRRSKRSPSGCPACRRSPASTRAFIAGSRPSPS